VKSNIPRGTAGGKEAIAAERQADDQEQSHTKQPFFPGSAPRVKADNSLPA